MAEYLIAYVGEKQMSKDEGMAHRKKWMDWIGGLGDAVVNMGTPLSKNQVVDEDGATRAVKEAERLTGFTIVEAKDMDAALAMAKESPYLGSMGHLQVAEVMKMGG